MIRTIIPIVEEIEPPLLLYTKECRLHLNAEILYQYHRRRIPILASFIAHTRTVLEQEHRMARHVLNRRYANFARPLVLSFLQYSPM